MCWVLLLLLSWLLMVACTYMIFYYESANGPHLELMRSRGSVSSQLLKGFFWTLYSHLVLVAITLTALHRRFWHLSSEPGICTSVGFASGVGSICRP